jgi:hypothetical protein
MATTNVSFSNATFTGGNVKDMVYGLAMCLVDTERVNSVGVAAELPATGYMSCHRGMVLW